MKFYYVYILQSESNPERFDTGFTDDIESRLREHNQSRCKHTSKFIPWRIKTAVVFADREKAMEFEKYLKTSSGRAFEVSLSNWPTRFHSSFEIQHRTHQHQIPQTDRNSVNIVIHAPHPFGSAQDRLVRDKLHRRPKSLSKNKACPRESGERSV